MPNTTTAEIPSAVNNFYDRVLLERAVALFLHSKYGQIRDIPRNSSEVIKFRKYGSLAAALTPLVEGVTPAGSALAITDISATVAQYGDFVTLTDFLLFTTLDPILVETAEVLGEQAGDTMDQLAAEVLSAGTNVQFASSATQRSEITDAMVLDDAEIREATRTLQNANAHEITSMVDPDEGYSTSPLNSCYVGLIHPNTLFDLQVADGFIPVEKYANKADVMMGEVGALGRVRFVQSTNGTVFAGEGDGGDDVYATLIFAKDAYGITRISGESMRNIVTPLGSAGSADPLKQRATSGWKATFVCKILQQPWILRIEHGVSA